MNPLNYFIVVVVLLLSACKPVNYNKKTGEGDIIIENAEMRLVIGSNGKSKSLLHKPTGQECLYQAEEISVFTLTQGRPYDNELHLYYPAKSKTFAADSVYWKDEDLIVSFKPERNIATIGVKITDEYIGFSLKEFNYDFKDFRQKRKTEVDEFTLLQLPIRDRENFGEWLNVAWDEEVAINLLATDPYAKIDAESRKGFHIFKAGMDANVKMEGVGAALITSDKKGLMASIQKVEEDFDLPRGVESRLSEKYKYSYYEVWDATTENIDEHITFAQSGGFKAIQIVWTAFASTIGHFPWNSEYPNGMKDLQVVIKKIKDAGMLAGAHFWYTKAEKSDSYVTPVPDYRLNLSRPFTLASSLDKKSNTVFVEQNPEGCTMEDERRILKIGDELIGYTSYTTEFPYQFTGCTRGVLNTVSSDYKKGLQFGLLDVDTWTKWVRFDQRTSIQQEMSERIGEIYNEAGFDFVYYDGAEDVHPPYWFYCSFPQLKVHNCLQPDPAFSEGALKSHFSWHIITRGNAFDTFKPEDVKDATRRYPLTEAELVSKDFTSINFGWIDYVVPGEETIGMQPDMFEFVCSKAAAWDCPISLEGKLDELRSHPRTSDNLEVIRRWEEARIKGFLNEEQKIALRNPDQEYILLLNENGEFELNACKQVKDIAGGDPNIRAFSFNREGKTCIAYWHTSGAGEVSLPLSAGEVSLFKELGEKVAITEQGSGIVLPVGDRHYLETNLSAGELESILKNSKLL